jgi:ADP-heptose:LPS heptosyltransferase
MSPPDLLVPGATRIAVLRATALGDLLFALPALESLRAAYPDAEIVLLARGWHARFLEGRPAPVDRVVALPEGIPPDGASGLPVAERSRVLRGLREEGWDVAIQLHGGGRHSNPVVRALGARVCAGSQAPDAPPLDRSIPYVYYQPEVFRNLEVVGLLGARPVTWVPRLEVTDPDRQALREVAPALVDREPLVVLHPGASDPRRRWPVSAFALVGDRLSAAGATVAITGTRDEAELVDGLAARMRAPSVTLAGALGLPALVALLERAALIVSNDTGPLHLARAVGSRSVGIYWCGNVINAGPPERARHRVAISWRLTCPDCGLDCTRAACPHRSSFVADVEPDEVAREALDLLGGSG